MVQAAYDNMVRQLGDRFKWNNFTVMDALNSHASDDSLRMIGGASEDELVTWAEAQARREGQSQADWERQVPAWLRNMGWWDSNGKWHNILWYH